VKKQNKQQKSSLVHEDGSINWKSLLVKTLILIVVAMALLVFYQRFVNTHQNLNIGQKLYNQYGMHGVSLFVYIVDSLLLPMTVDVMFPLIQDWSLFKVVVVMGTASALGGYTGYWIGRGLSKIPPIHRVLTRLVGTHETLIKKRGAWAVVLAAISPLPYSTICWAAGLFAVNNKKVLLACVARYLRMFIYYLIFTGSINLFT